MHPAVLSFCMRKKRGKKNTFKGENLVVRYAHCSSMQPKFLIILLGCILEQQTKFTTKGLTPFKQPSGLALGCFGEQIAKHLVTMKVL